MARTKQSSDSTKESVKQPRVTSKTVTRKPRKSSSNSSGTDGLAPPPQSSLTQERFEDFQLLALAAALATASTDSTQQDTKQRFSLRTALAHPNPLYSLAGFSFIEGVVLYSSFAFLKHFQSAGKNKLLNISRGINFSVRDENIHAVAGAWVFKQLKKEAELDLEELVMLSKSVENMAHIVYEHECRVIDMVFEKGEIEGITSLQMKRFVESRINQCMFELGYDKIFEVEYNPINDWFYKGINGFTFNDSFSGVGNSYVRTWDDASFVYKEWEDVPDTSQV